MDNEKAARILARELSANGKRELIIEESHKEHILKNSSAFYQVAAQIYGEQSLYKRYDNGFTQAIIKNLLSEYSYLEDANYLFITNIAIIEHKQREYGGTSKAPYVVTPYALIGENEKQNIKELCYKDVPENILYAMDVFSIDNYIYEYQDYLQDIYFNLSDDFFNFIFRIPYENQKIQCNKLILKNSEVRDYPEILTNEYVKGKYFQEYFNCLDNDCQQKVVKYLKHIKERNLSHDSFLWSKGFKEIKLDYMQIYKETEDAFIKYFKSKNHDDKKIILKDIMNC
ncbi:MAG: hypothetical protein KAS15_04950, partial [Nanoarchaeota archaeon]|nr:hypothetical protein [Nanoarchaeota archaeon]